MLRRSFLKAAAAALAGLGLVRPGRVLSLKAGELEEFRIDDAVLEQMKSMWADHIRRYPLDAY